MWPPMDSGFTVRGWRESVFAAPGEVIRKQATLQFQLVELRRVWLDMLPGAQARHIRRLVGTWKPQASCWSLGQGRCLSPRVKPPP
jgi:hypothetical protein